MYTYEKWNVLRLFNNNYVTKLYDTEPLDYIYKLSLWLKHMTFVLYLYVLKF